MTRHDKHILVAEDDLFLADMMGKALSNYVVRVTVVHNGQEALDVMTTDIPDLLLLDLLMPVLDGHGVMKAMQQKKIDCPIVVVSNISDKMTRQKCKEMNVKDYFVKSDMDDDNLWGAIEKYVK